MKKIILLSLLFGASFVSANQDRRNLDRGIKKIEACYGSQDEPEICTAKFLNRKLNRVLNKLNRTNNSGVFDQYPIEENVNCFINSGGKLVANGVVVEQEEGEKNFDYIQRAYSVSRCSNTFSCSFKAKPSSKNNYCQPRHYISISFEGVKVDVGTTRYSCDFRTGNGKKTYGSGDLASHKERYNSLVARNICKDLN